MKLLLAGAALAGLIAYALPAQGMAGAPGAGWGERPPMPSARAEVEAKVAEHFAMIDADHDGVVIRAEFEAFLAKKRVEWEAKRKEHRDNAFDRLDKNKDGKLSRAEFDSPPPPGGPEGPDHDGGPDGWHHHRPQPGLMAQRWFERLDADHDGRVTLAEAKAAALDHFDRLGPDRGGMRGPHGRRGDMPPPPPPLPDPSGPVRGPGYDLPAGTPPARAPQTT